VIQQFNVGIVTAITDRRSAILILSSLHWIVRYPILPREKSHDINLTLSMSQHIIIKWKLLSSSCKNWKFDSCSSSRSGVYSYFRRLQILLRQKNVDYCHSLLRLRDHLWWFKSMTDVCTLFFYRTFMLVEAIIAGLWQ